MASFLTYLRSLLKCYILNNVFPDHLFKVEPLISVALLHFSPSDILCDLIIYYISFHMNIIAIRAALFVLFTVHALTT